MVTHTCFDIFGPKNILEVGGCSSRILVEELVVTKPPWLREAENRLSVSYRLESVVDELVGHQTSLAKRS